MTTAAGFWSIDAIFFSLSCFSPCTKHLAWYPLTQVWSLTVTCFFVVNCSKSRYLRKDDCWGEFQGLERVKVSKANE